MNMIAFVPFLFTKAPLLSLKSTKVSHRNFSCQRRVSKIPTVCLGDAGKRNPLLEMKNINYRPHLNYEQVVFEQMNFRIFAGEFVIVVGENGSGKSTALSIMTGLTKLPRRDGSLYWQGEKIKASKIINKVGVVLQNPADYFITSSVLDELIMGRPTKTPDDVRRVMSATGLQDVSLKAHPGSLSGGQARRLAVAGQLMRTPLPQLFVLDEPLAGVDWAARRDLVGLLGSLKSQFSVIIVSHEPGELLQYADRVVEVGRGGMHDIDRAVIDKAIIVRKKRLAGRRAKALKDAEAYRAQKR